MATPYVTDESGELCNFAVIVKLSRVTKLESYFLCVINGEDVWVVGANSIRCEIRKAESVLSGA